MNELMISSGRPVWLARCGKDFSEGGTTMPDREKVMSALDCRANDTDIDCRKCDYYIREDKPEYCDFRGMLRDALALLKKQEPVRCKDCKHGQYEEWNNGECADKTVYCDGYGIHKSDWFCADGKRKEGR